MTSWKSGASRLAVAMGVGAVVIAVAGACTDSPKEQSDRERKAASVQVFRLHMAKDLWTRTGAGEGTHRINKPLSLTDEGNGIATIDLSGPQLVDYLQALDYDAHGGFGAQDPSLAQSVYNTIGPVIDKIQANRSPNAPVPEVTIDAGTGPGTSTAPASPTAAAPAK